MAEKKGDKPVKNSLLNIASTGFSIEDFSDARLLVPVSVQEEILKNLPEATAEIDLQSDDASADDKSYLLPVQSPENLSSGDNSSKSEQGEKSSRDSFLSYFSAKAKDVKDSFPSLNPTSSDTKFTTPTPPPPTSFISSQHTQPPLLPPPPRVEPERKPPMSMPTLYTPIAPQPVELISPVGTVLRPEEIEALAPIELDERSQTPTQTSEEIMPAIIPAFDDPPVGTTASSIVDSASTPGFYNPLAFGTAEATAPSFLPAAPPSAPAAPASVPLISNAIQPEVPSASTLPTSSSPQPHVGAQGSVNKYRLGHQRPQYAQYPGLLPTMSAVTNMGNLPSQPPLAVPPVQAVAPLPPTNPSSTAQSPLTPSYPQEYAGTGYVFGEPPPTKNAPPANPLQYTPVTYHWFFYKEVEGKGIWKPFSMLDSISLEDAYMNGSTGLVATDGGRYDVNVMQRLRTPVYWEDTPTEVRRCSWFFKGPLDNRFIPYEEDFAQQIEGEFEAAINTGVWQRRVELGGGEAIILHNANVIVHFCQAASPDEWGNLPESQLRPRVVKRGVDKSFMIEDGESAQIDHLVFLVHGIGAICDFKFRSIVEAVDDFRSLSSQLLHTHFTNALDKGVIGRVEFLPVCWHKALHGDCGVDRKLKPITLHSIPRLRHFTNDTLLDILFYTSPVYCQRIVDTVGNEINRLYNLFLSRNLNFDGSVSLSGHSLGSLILFDLLAHQPANIRVDSVPPLKENTPASTEIPSAEDKTLGGAEAEAEKSTGTQTGSSKMVSYTIGQAGTGQPLIVYPAFDFHPECFFALGSPTAVFISVRGIDQLGMDFKLPTCGTFFNIFHPYDPVAYRMEPLIDPNFDKPPLVIPHHKGRKRFHLEIKDAMLRMGTDFKQTMVETIKSTWKTVYSYASFGRGEEASKANLEQEIDRVIEDELAKSDENQNEQAQFGIDVQMGKLNGGRRIDYVLQEGPLESFNEYLFALTSHVCYWESEDTMLLILKEIYSTIGVSADNRNYSSAFIGTQGGASNQPQPSAPPPSFIPISQGLSSTDGNPYRMSAVQKPSASAAKGPVAINPYATTWPSSVELSEPVLTNPPQNIMNGQYSAFYQPPTTLYGSYPAAGQPSTTIVSATSLQNDENQSYYSSIPKPTDLPLNPVTRASPYNEAVGNNNTNVSPAAAAPFGPPPLAGFIPKSQ